jgi:hypothetical protein
VGLLLAAGPGNDGFVTIDIPGSTFVEAYGIDNHGVVTGLYLDAASNYHGFVYQNGVVTTVDGPTSNPPLSQAQLFNINNKGGIGAYFVDDNGNQRAAVYNLKTQAWTALPVIAGAAYNAAGGVNANGVAAGNWFSDPTQATGSTGWTFDPKIGSYSFFDVPGADKVNYIGTVVNDINNAGTIVGLYQDSDGVFHGFTRTGNQYQTIDIPGTLNTQVWGINSQGDLAGRYRIGDTRHGFVLRHTGELMTFDVPGAISTWLTAISENGNIAGYYKTEDGNFHGYFVLKAVP